MIDLARYAAVLLDLDGTIYHEDEPLPGAIDLLRGLAARNRTFACLSNSTDSPDHLAVRLERMGAAIGPEHIYTAAAATADHVRAMAARPRVFDLVTDGLRDLLGHDVEWVREWPDHAPAPSPLPPCDVVVSGNPQCLYATPHRQHVALQLLRNGAKLVGVCADRGYPSVRGMEIGTGALTHMLGYAANVEPTFCGKPDAVFYRALCNRLHVNPADCILIGDNLETDIVGANALGMATVLVLTGVSRRGDAAKLGADFEPDWVVNRLDELSLG